MVHHVRGAVRPVAALPAAAPSRVHGVGNEFLADKIPVSAINLKMSLSMLLAKANDVVQWCEELVEVWMVVGRRVEWRSLPIIPTGAQLPQPPVLNVTCAQRQVKNICLSL